MLLTVSYKTLEYHFAAPQISQALADWSISTSSCNCSLNVAGGASDADMFDAMSIINVNSRTATIADDWEGGIAKL